MTCLSNIYVNSIHIAACYLKPAVNYKQNRISDKLPSRINRHDLLYLDPANLTAPRFNYFDV